VHITALACSETVTFVLKGSGPQIVDGSLRILKMRRTLILNGVTKTLKRLAPDARNGSVTTESFVLFTSVSVVPGSEHREVRVQ
jgi:hypothetical protein